MLRALESLILDEANSTGVLLVLLFLFYLAVTRYFDWRDNNANDQR
jgi:hypothetical protein